MPAQVHRVQGFVVGQHDHLAGELRLGRRAERGIQFPEQVRRHRQVEGGWGDGSRVIRYRSWMTTPRDPIYAGYRYPAELTSYAVWLYFRFPLSLRMVEEMLAARGISVTYETIRQWGLKFGREF